MSYLLDSCIIIDHLRNHDAATLFLRGAQRAAISQLTWIEVMVGADDAATEPGLRALLAGFAVLPVDDAVAEETVRLRRARRLKLPDAIIFATARVHGRELVTRNTKDFPPGTPGVVVPYQLS